MPYKFEPCIGKEDVTLPARSTSGSAGYDFVAAEDVEVPSIISQFIKGFFFKMPVLPTTVWTNVKAKMRSNEVLILCNRSSNPSRGLVLANGIGIVDSDYYGNGNNDGNIGFAFYNFMPWTVTVKKGQKIGQGVFSTYLKIKESEVLTRREGGFGSTGE